MICFTAANENKNAMYHVCPQWIYCIWKVQVYWKPVYETFEDSFTGNIPLLVVNARHMKNVPGKKTDMRDTQWIATLLRAGLLNGSFIPDKEIRDFRDLTQYRKNVVHDIISQKNIIDKFLQISGFGLSTFISDIFGASGRNIINYLIDHGQINKSQLNECLKTNTRKRIYEILIAVNGTVSVHQRSFLKMIVSHLDVLNSHLKDIEAPIGVQPTKPALLVISQVIIMP